MSHTPGPWKYTSDKSYDEYYERSNVRVTGADKEQGCILSACSCCEGVSCDTADIKRIIACVNACAGMKNPAKDIAKLKAGQQ